VRAQGMQERKRDLKKFCQIVKGEKVGGLIMIMNPCLASRKKVIGRGV